MTAKILPFPLRATVPAPKNAKARPPHTLVRRPCPRCGACDRRVEWWELDDGTVGCHCLVCPVPVSPAKDPACDHCGGDPDTICPLCDPAEYEAVTGKPPLKSRPILDPELVEVELAPDLADW